MEHQDSQIKQSPQAVRLLKCLHALLVRRVTVRGRTCRKVFLCSECKTVSVRHVV